MKRLVLLLLIVISHSLAAQSFDELKKQATQRFDKARTHAESSFKTLKQEQNEHFQKKIREQWKLMGWNDPVPSPPEDEIPPVVIEDDTVPVPEDNPIVFEEIAPSPEPGPSPTPVFPIEENTSPGLNTASFLLYGTPVSIRYPDFGTMKGVSESDVARFWGRLSKEDIDNTLYDCLLAKEKYSLCDWAYMKMTEAFASVVFGSSSSPESVVLQAYLLTHSGFLLYLARDRKGGLHKLMPMDRNLYDYPYFMVSGRPCYLLDGSKESGLDVMESAFKGTAPMSISNAGGNNFAGNPSPVRVLTSRDYSFANAKVLSNKNLIDFFGGYPESVENNDFMTRWRFYANTPLSDEVKKTLYPSLLQAIGGKSEAEAAGILLNFVQTAFEYEYDVKVWGGDRVFFAEETLYYPYCDCEDRSILFSRLIRDLLGLDVLLVYYPGHLATAVGFGESVSGDYLLLGGKRYVVCDPTYIGAPVGLTMPGMDNTAAKVIKL